MGRLALKIPPRGSNTDMMPNGTPTPGVRLAFWAAKREEGSKWRLTGEVGGALRYYD